MKDESLSQELERKRKEVSDYCHSLDLEDKTFISKKADEYVEDFCCEDMSTDDIYDTIRKAYIDGWWYSREQPPFKTMHIAIMYAFDYVRSKVNYFNIIKKVYKLFREIRNGNTDVQGD